MWLVSLKPLFNPERFWNQQMKQPSQGKPACVMLKLNNSSLSHICFSFSSSQSLCRNGDRGITPRPLQAEWEAEDGCTSSTWTVRGINSLCWTVLIKLPVKTRGKCFETDSLILVKTLWASFYLKECSQLHTTQLGWEFIYEANRPFLPSDRNGNILSICNHFNRDWLEKQEWKLCAAEGVGGSSGNQ